MNTQLMNQVRALSVDERIELAEAIWDSIEPADAGDVTEAQRAELERRLAEHEASPSDTVPWSEVRAEALSRLRR